jgi:hypothetical protein
MRRAEVPESFATKISGHTTRHVLERYNVVNTAEVEQAMEQTSAFHLAEDAKFEQPGVRPNSPQRRGTSTEFVRSPD